ncbi:MAG: carbohydrate ABC transporter permease [Spirochaetaceae bacterium]|jgi:putative aldouronate transport system permease protein|nr:carbohydrate ABC transporter permease [Spirochaetaceae bacterium]
MFKRKSTLERRSLEDTVFDGIIFGILTLIFFVVAYPLYFVVISSISDPIKVASGQVVFFPEGLNLDGYRKVLETGTVMRGFFNSLYYTILGVAINLALTLPTSYALSRKDFYGRKAISIFYIITMFVSGGLIPTYIVVRSAGFLDTVWALVVPGSLSVYNMMVARTFFQTNIPGELLDAARIDGCGNTRFFFSMVLPISGAIIAILVLWYGVGHWNSYFSALLYLSTREKQPLQMELRYILLLNTESTQAIVSAEALKEKERMEALKEMMKYSLIVISNIPVMILYPFIQKHFVKGVTVGSLKG